MNVQLPDNTIVEFPDDMPEDQVESAIRAHLAGAAAPSVPNTGGASGALTNFASGMAFGQGPKFMSGLGAEGLAEATPALIAGGINPAEVAAGNTPERYATDEAAYAAEHPTVSRALRVAGALVPSITGAGLLNTGIRALAPEALGRFLTGEAGYTATGDAAKGFGALLTRVGSQGTQGAIQGATSGAVATPSLGGDLVQNVEQGAELGGPAGAVLGTGTNALVNFLRGHAVSPETADVASTFLRNGIDLRAAQIAKGGSYTSDQAKQFTRALSQTFGEDSEGLTPSVMQAAKDRIGQNLDKAYSGIQLKWTPKLEQDIDGVESGMQGTLQDPLEQKALQNVIDEVRSKGFAQGTVGGDQYQAWTQYGSPLGRLLGSNDANVRYYAGQLRSVLDNAALRASPPDAVSALQSARTQFKNLNVAEGLAEKAGPDGTVDPKQLLSAVIKSYPQLAYSGTPGSNIGDLAKGASTFLKEPKSEALTKTGLLGAEVAGGGGFAGMDYLLHGGLTPETAGAAAAGLAVPYGLYKAYNSPAFARYLISRGLNPTNPGLRMVPRIGAGLGPSLNFNNGTSP